MNAVAEPIGLSRRVTPRGASVEMLIRLGAGVVRGLLCGPCNRMIGLAKDDVRRLRRAADYLEAAA